MKAFNAVVRMVMVGVLMAIACSVAAQQEYPSKPIRLIVPFPAGGTTDILARVMANKLGAQLGQQIVVDNRAAASGIVGTEIAANAMPNGYTLLLGSSSSLAINTVTYAHLPYDPLKNFAPVSLLGILPWLMIAKPSLPAQSVSEFITLAKSEPGKLFYAASSSSAELATQWFSNVAGIKMTGVPYRGTADAVKDLLAGRLDMMINPIATAYPLVRAGKARALAITTSQRSPLAPEVPTLAEQGIAGFDVAVWHCLMLPAGSPQSIVERLNRETAKILQSAEVKAQFARQGAEARASTPQALDNHIRVEIARWQKVARDAGIKPTN
ncbi:MAG: tripartite tricarboxylate transporter substrate binding protein [Pseudomonadota bacterium]